MAGRLCAGGMGDVTMERGAEYCTVAIAALYLYLYLGDGRCRLLGVGSVLGMFCSSAEFPGNICGKSWAW